jgi:hypothetical protein
MAGMRRRKASLALLLSASGLCFSSHAEERDPAAIVLAKKEMEATGGKNWEKARYFRFDFIVDLGTRKAGPFAHYWDRFTGRYRVDVPGDDGFTAYFNVNEPKDAEKAVILHHGTRVTGEDAAKILTKAYGRFINDSYWLLAPLKVLDPGVNLADGGKGTFDGKSVRILKLSFSGVGLTPGDVYQHFLDPETGRMLGWEYTLESKQQGKWKWADVADYAGLQLSTRKVTEDGARTIKFENVAVSSTVDEPALKPPAF